MAIDSVAPRSRRAILLAAFGGVAAATAAAIERAAPVEAANGDVVHAGSANVATSPTVFANVATAKTVLVAQSVPSNGGGGGVGLSAASDTNFGVRGQSRTRSGVYGFSEMRAGVLGESASGPGVQGVTPNQNGAGVVGASAHIGLEGHSTNTSGEHYGVYADSKSPSARGVFGRSRSSSGGTGAWGQVDGPGGVGVRGLAWSATNGSNGYGTGVIGSSGSQSWPDPWADTGVLGVAGHFGVAGRATKTSGEHYGVYGESGASKARGVFGRSLSAVGGTGAWGQADGPGGAGVRGLAWNSNDGTGGYGTGVIGSSGSQTWPNSVANVGVLGVGTGGRGGVFVGDDAQVRLQPSVDGDHPEGGLRGDLFVDSTGRLWYCKGPGNWKQLA